MGKILYTVFAYKNVIQVAKTHGINPVTLLLLVNTIPVVITV